MTIHNSMDRFGIKAAVDHIVTQQGDPQARRLVEASLLKLDPGAERAELLVEINEALAAAALPRIF